MIYSTVYSMDPLIMLPKEGEDTHYDMQRLIAARRNILRNNYSIRQSNQSAMQKHAISYIMNGPPVRIERKPTTHDIPHDQALHPNIIIKVKIRCNRHITRTYRESTTNLYPARLIYCCVL